MIFTANYRIGLEEIETNGYATTKSIMTFMEDIAGMHGAQAGHGLLDIKKNKAAWVLLDWQIQILNRPKYSDNIKVNTWAKMHDKLVAYRDFEVFSDDNELVAKGTSRWLYMDLIKRRPIKLTDEMMSAYREEKDKSAFSEGLNKIEIPQNEKFLEFKYNLLRRDMDVNGHMHNLSYLDAVFDIMPEELYRKVTFNNVRIEYKKEIMKDSDVIIRFYQTYDRCIATFSTEDKLNAIIELRQ